MSTSTHRDDVENARAQAAARLGHLLERSAAGDTAAFAALYAETAPRAFGLALRVAGDRSDAEEVTQEAYVKIWRTAGRFDARKGNCQGWIFMIVHRVAIDHVRSVGARILRDDRHHRETSALDSVHGDLTYDLAHVSLEAALAREALAGLSHPQRQALELAYLDGHTYSDVARLLGVPSGTVKSRIRHGLIRLRDSMSPPGGLPARP